MKIIFSIALFVAGSLVAAPQEKPQKVLAELVKTQPDKFKITKKVDDAIIKNWHAVLARVGALLKSTSPESYKEFLKLQEQSTTIINNMKIMYNAYLKKQEKFTSSSVRYAPIEAEKCIKAIFDVRDTLDKQLGIYNEKNFETKLNKLKKQYGGTFSKIKNALSFKKIGDEEILDALRIVMRAQCKSIHEDYREHRVSFVS